MCDCFFFKLIFVFFSFPTDFEMRLHLNILRREKSAHTRVCDFQHHVQFVAVSSEIHLVGNLTRTHSFQLNRCGGLLSIKKIFFFHRKITAQNRPTYVAETNCKQIYSPTTNMMVNFSLLPNFTMAHFDFRHTKYGCCYSRYSRSIVCCEYLRPSDTNFNFTHLCISKFGRETLFNMCIRSFNFIYRNGTSSIEIISDIIMHVHLFLYTHVKYSMQIYIFLHIVV